MTDRMRPTEVRKYLTQRENRLTNKMYAGVQQCMNTDSSPAERGMGWRSALDAATDKSQAALLMQSMLLPRPAEQASLLSYTQNDRIYLQKASPLLDAVVESGEVYSHAAYAIAEYFVNSGTHQLNPEQMVAVARLFPPRGNESPEDYNARVDAMPLTNMVPGKTEGETWTMRREISDMLEIEAQLERKYLLPAFGKTISIRDLTKISAHCLRMVHEAATAEGLAAIQQRDAEMLVLFLFPNN